MNDSKLQDSYDSRWGVTALKFSGFSGMSRQPYAVRLIEAGPDLNTNWLSSSACPLSCLPSFTQTGCGRWPCALSLALLEVSPC